MKSKFDTEQNAQITKYTLSIGVSIKNDTIAKAKKYLKDRYGSKYDDPDPHLNFLIMAMPEGKKHKIVEVLDRYFSKFNKLNIKLGKLNYEDKNNFFSLPIIEGNIMEMHKDLIDLLNPIRSNYIREKDDIRIGQGKVDEIEKRYIYNYGYLRVLDKFTPHVTIGNLSENFVNSDIVDIKRSLDHILGQLYSVELSFNLVYATHILDAETQSDYKIMWEREFFLK